MLMRLTRKYMSVRFCFYSAMFNIFSKHPDAAWCSDIMYIWIFEGFVHLTSVIESVFKKNHFLGIE